MCADWVSDVAGSFGHGDCALYYSLYGECCCAVAVIASVTEFDASASDELILNSDFVGCCESVEPSSGSDAMASAAIYDSFPVS